MKGLAGRALAVLATPALVAGCALALGVQDDPGLVVPALCGCPDVGKIVNDCETTLANRLALALPATRAAWLQTYSTAQCSLCTNATSCFYLAPTCAAPEDPCTKPSECCSFSQNPLTACVFNGGNGACK